MLRLAVAYVLVATTVLVYLVVVSNEDAILLKSSVDTNRNVVRAKPPVRVSLKMLSPPSAPSEINSERRLVRTMLFSLGVNISHEMRFSSI